MQLEQIFNHEARPPSPPQTHVESTTSNPFTVRLFLILSATTFSFLLGLKLTYCLFYPIEKEGNSFLELVTLNKIHFYVKEIYLFCALTFI